MAISQDDNIVELQRTVERQSAQIADLQAQVATLLTRSESKRGVHSRGSSTSRRRMLQRLAMLAAGLTVLGATDFSLSTQPAHAEAEAHADASDGETLQTSVTFTDGTFAATLPPLNSSVTWSRGMNHTDATLTPQQLITQHLASELGHTFTPEVPSPVVIQALLSLIYEVSQDATDSYAYPLYVQLRTAHTTGDCTGINSTMFQTGDGWATAIHAEPHQDDGAGITIGLNVEASRSAGTGRIIGANIEAANGYGDQGINIQSGPVSTWGTGLNFDWNSQGTRAIWIQGNWVVGLDLGNNHMRMNAGQKICLEPTEAVYLTYNPSSQRIEFWRDGDMVASF
ncbi:MAG: hypothetical protein ACLQUY_06735 [Ktedonobacterales bacterium]